MNIKYFLKANIGQKTKPPHISGSRQLNGRNLYYLAQLWACLNPIGQR